jgi:hypothetical protein
MENKGEKQKHEDRKESPALKAFKKHIIETIKVREKTMERSSSQAIVLKET